MDQQMTGLTMTMAVDTTHSRATRAACSLAAVDRIRDVDARRAAFAEHMAEFPPTIGRF